MPPNLHKKLRKLSEQEGRILLAISALKKQEICNVAEAACVYRIPCTTL
jgi:hypothetical protein